MMIIAIIQARVGSTRLPNKVLKLIEDKTVLEHVLTRVHKCSTINDIYVATTISHNDLQIVKLCSEQNVGVFIGSEDDVLDRYYQLSKLLPVDHIVRITADCPVIDPEIIDLVIKSHIKSNSDYTSNTLVATYPDGLDVEVFSFKALQKAWKEAKLNSEREHVTPYIKNHPKSFVLTSIISNKDYSNKRWTLDTESDYKFLCILFKELYKKLEIFGMNDILAFLNQHPNLESINSDNVRNEGYLKSIEKENKIQ